MFNLALRVRLSGWMPALLAACASTCISEAARMLYVSPAGDDGAAGTVNQPFRQIRRALALVQPGDTVLVADGSYLGFDAFDKIGTADAPITIRALGTNAVITPTTDRSDNRDTIHIEDSVHFVVDGLRSFGANRAALRVQGGHHVTVRNCVFGDNTRWGLFTGFSEHLLIEGNECFGSTNEHGIYVSNSADHPVLRGNRCWGNAGGGIQLNADVNIQPGDGIITNALLENNVLYDNGRLGGGAINLDGVQHSVVRNNLLFDNHASGIIFFQIDGAEGPRGNHVYHNTIDMAADGRWALNFLQTTGTNVARNNILLTRHSFRGGLRFGSAADAANTDSDYNLVTRITPDDSAILTLAEWQAQGHELHSVTGTLAGVFANADARCYLLAGNAPAVDAAAWLAGVPVDIEGAPRPWGTLPDMGCYEQAPARLSIRSIADGWRIVRLTGGIGASLRWETNTVPENWSPALTTTRSNRWVEYWEPPAASGNRFYRAVLLP